MGKNTILIVLGAIILFCLVGLLLYSSGKKANEVCGVSNGEVTVGFYDINHKPICVPKQKALSLVNSVRGVYYIDMSTKVTNTGAIAIFCNILNTGTFVNKAYDADFNKAWSDSGIFGLTRTLPVGSSTEWTSNQFAVAKWESQNMTEFITTVRCQYTDSSGAHPISPDKNASIELNIKSDGTGDFSVSLIQGGLPSLYCGDGRCNSSIGETNLTCPVDCINLGNSSFRTSDLSYPIGGAIAYTPTCGSTPTRYGYETSSCWGMTGTSCPTYSGYTRVLSTKTIPGTTSWGNTSTPTCLYNKTTDGTRMAVAFQVASTGGSPCGVVGQWAAVNYWTGSSYTGEVANSITTINQQKEVTCP